MTPTQEHIERLAQYLCVSFGVADDNWDDLDNKHRLPWRLTAEEILTAHYAALAADGWQMVRKEPEPESHLGPTCDKRGRKHIWLTTEHGHDICLNCKLTQPTPKPPGEGI